MNPPWTPLQRRTWLANRHTPHLLPVPVLRPAYPIRLQWDWNLPNPYRWNVWTSLDDGVSFIFTAGYWANGSARQFAPDGGSEWYYIVGVAADGKEITRHSTAVRPDDAPLPPDLNPGLVAHFSMDELEGNRMDVVAGFGLAPTNGTTPAAAGLLGNSVAFDGDGGYLAGIEETDMFVAGTAGLSISVWANFDYVADPEATCYIVSLWKDSGWPAGSAWHIFAIPNSGQVGAEVLGVVNGFETLSGVGTLSGWVHICLVFDPLAVLWSLYLNGTVIATVTCDAVAVAGFLGVGAHTAPVTGPPDYLVDELAIWARKLSATEVGVLYNQGNGLLFANY